MPRPRPSLPALCAVALLPSAEAHAQAVPADLLKFGFGALEQAIGQQRRAPPAPPLANPSGAAPSSPQEIEVNKSIQSALASGGYFRGAIDGVLGPDVRDAIARFQKERGLPPTGVLTARQIRVLLAPSGTPTRLANPANISSPDQGGLALQEALVAAGYYQGPVSDTWSPLAIRAVRRFQGDLGHRQTGRFTPEQATALKEMAARKKADEAQSGAPARDGAAPGSVAAKPGAGEKNYDPILGRWRGPITCGRNEASDSFLTVEAAADGRYQATLDQFPKAHLESGSLSIDLVGEYDAAEQAYRFAASRNVRLGILALNIRHFLATLAADGSGAELKFPAQECRPATLGKHDPRFRNLPSAVASDGGAFFRAADQRQRCEALVTWANRLKSEFGIPDLNRVTGSYGKAALLYGDDSFVAAFGVQFDRLPEDRRQMISESLRSTCRRDPLFEQRFQGAPIFDRPLNRSNLTSFGSISVTYVVQSQREVRNRLRDGLAEIDRSQKRPRPAFGALEARLGELKGVLDGSGHLLWPGEQAKLRQQLTDRLTAIVAAAGKANIADLAAAQDGDDLLVKMNAILDGKEAWFERLSSAEKAGYAAELSARRAVMVERLTGPILEAMNRQARSFDGIGAVDALFETEKAKLGLLDKASAERMNNARSDWQNAVLRELADGDLLSLQQAPEGRRGLAATAEWLSSFDAKFSRFRDTVAIKEALRRFWHERVQRLKSAVPDFQREIAALPGASGAEAAAVKLVLDRYLSLPDDWTRPVSLEYQLVVAERASTW